MASENFIRFDWAIKRLLRQKSNFVVLEGLLSVLLNDDVKIERMLESEGNQDNATDKFNRVDMLAENSRGELMIIEIQNYRELDYFHRMLYGASKAVTEYISLGDSYSKVRKIYSINVLYFDLGQGKDYAYHGRTDFTGMTLHDVLQLSDYQQQLFACKNAGELFPEYYILRVDDFNKNAVTPLEEWIAFLKTGDIPANANAKGLPEARELLMRDRLSESERQEYDAHMEAVRYQRSVIESNVYIGKMEGLKDGEQIRQELQQEKQELQQKLSDTNQELADMKRKYAELEQQLRNSHK